MFWLKKYKQAVYRIHKLFILSKFPLIVLIGSLRQANVVKIMVKSLGTLAFLGCFPIHTCPTLPLPSPHKQHWTRVYRNFPSFNFVYGAKGRGGGGGEGELQENSEKDALFYEGNYRKL